MPRVPPLRPLDEALAELLGHAQPLAGTETVSTFDADGRVLAQDLVSGAAGAAAGQQLHGWLCGAQRRDRREGGVSLPVSQRIPAGSAAAAVGCRAAAARIFTGATVPEGADAIVMQEDTEPAGERGAHPDACPSRASGSAAAARTSRVAPWCWQRGERLTPAGLGLAAGIGLRQVQVARRPRVALFSTGDELVMPGRCRPSA